MSRPSLRSRAPASALLVLVACSSGHRATPIDATPAHGDAALVDAAPVALDQVTTRASAAICGALFRCCETDLAEYFAPYRAQALLADFADRLPPAATLDDPTCRTVVRQMLDIVPLGDWVRAATAGQVAFDAAAFGRCEQTLATASCGAPTRAALWDSTCFGFAPPNGGDQQRAFVRRTRGAGEACAPIHDGLGASFYGTCDPTRAFCCYADPTHPGCQFPFASGGAARPGTCAAVAAVGQTCSTALPLALCATGVECSDDSETCVAPGTAPLALGATCVDASYVELGTCTDGWCDVLGTKTCQAFLADGAACSDAGACRSGRCTSGHCVAVTTCDGPTAPGDAGVDAPVAIDAPAATDPEVCATAPTLASASVASTTTGYTWRVSRAFGAHDDYNPYKSSGHPPACSIVYDARGKELAYAITLAPGDRLKLRAELLDGKDAGIYLLDSCPAATWADFDGTGACGSNEYNVGFCGPVGCDPATLDIAYPTAIDGVPTATKQFWVVIDQVGGDDSSGFVLDWALIH